MLNKIPHAGTVLLAALLLAGCAGASGGGSSTIGAGGSDPTPTAGDPNVDGQADQPTP